MTKRSVTFLIRRYEWGRLNHQKATKGDNKVSKSTFSEPIIGKKAAYWPLSGLFLRRLWPALSGPLGNMSLFCPQAGKRCPEGVPEHDRIRLSRAGFPHQTKRRVFPQNGSGTLKRRQESAQKSTFCEPNIIQAAPLIGLSRLCKKV